MPRSLVRIPRLSVLPFLLAAALALAAPAAAQQRDTVVRPIRIPDSTRVQSLRLRDGSTVIGRASQITADTVVFETNVGSLRIPRTSIAEVREVATSTMKRGEVWPANPNDTRLFFAPTGRMLGANEGYFSDTYVFFLNAAYGVTSRVTLGGGFSLLPLDDFSDNVFYLTPKIGVVSSERFNLAIGALAAFAGALDDGNDQFGVLYGVGTFGGPDASFSFGSGLAYTREGFADRPVFMLGGEARVARRVALVTENYLLPGEDINGLISYGVRFFGEKLSVDLALWNVPGEDINFPGIPYVAFALKF